MADEKPKAIVLGVFDEDDKPVGAIAVTNDDRLDVEAVLGDFQDCLDEISEAFDINDDSAVVTDVAEAWLESEFEAFDPVSCFYDPSTGTSVRKLVKYVAGRLDAKTVGYIRFEVGGVSEMRVRLEDVLPLTPKPAPARRSPKPF